jgi:hypothetical protein
VTAERAPIGLKEPPEKCLNGISRAAASKINRSAMRTARGKEPQFGVDHDPVSTFDVLFSARPAGFRGGVK